MAGAGLRAELLLGERMKDGGRLEREHIPAVPIACRARTSWFLRALAGAQRGARAPAGGNGRGARNFLRGALLAPLACLTSDGHRHGLKRHAASSDVCVPRRAPLPA